MNTYTDLEAKHIIKRRLCARCYGQMIQLAVKGKPGVYRLDCPTCGDAWGGRTISKWTAERRAQQGLNEALEVRLNLADLFPNRHKGRPAGQLIREIGK